KSRICDEDGRAKSNYYKAVNDNKRKGQDRGKPYGDKNKKGDESSGGRRKNSGNCYKCGEAGQKIAECPQKEDKCFRCG
ncbi:cellular nucleic acid-binding protein, partial [Trifolium medium]|nr:cellular nucleic acid-binding protein [Trifolium medium]